MVYCPATLGTVALGLGLAMCWRRVLAARGWEKAIALGPVFMAAPLATFGGEHLAGAQFIAQGVPAFLPWHLFWAYLVGVALEATALSLIFFVWERLATAMAAGMILLFVLTIHTPNLAANPKDRIVWAVLLRDLVFALGLAAFAATRPGTRLRRLPQVAVVARVVTGLVLIFFAVEHFLHPGFTAGVPLGKETPGWFPAGAVLAYLTGALLAVCGAALAANRYAKEAAVVAGLWMVVLTLVLYVPILASDVTIGGTGPLVEGINYVFDTLMMAGTLLMLADEGLGARG
jgi:uncharacterized membrane protein YphA (DoxX/SURF4 family)